MKLASSLVVVLLSANVVANVCNMAKGQVAGEGEVSQENPRYKSPALKIEEATVAVAVVGAVRRYNKQVAELDEDFGERLEPSRKKALKGLQRELQKAGADGDATAGNLIDLAIATIEERAETPLSILARNKGVNSTARKSIRTFYLVLQQHDQNYRDALGTIELKLVTSLEVEAIKARKMDNAASFQAITNVFRQLKATPRKSLSPARFDRRRFSPGMIILEYANDLDQMVNENGVLLDYELGKPLAIKAQMHKGAWVVTEGGCAVAKFYIKIDSPGDYFFRVYGHYTGNAILAVDGTVIKQSKTRNGSVETRVTLQPGMIPVVSVGRVGNKTVDIRWRPDGSKSTTYLPAASVYYDRRQLQAFRRAAK